ncbi:hypothetical protein CW745_06140 [Psychromonas sp. psych-6C06]|uniref:hypothetical protein n=1 Tax=Psychromonas sp. psych-6C06 TaxID=2058089 RepID=UPI000C34E74C|nr:hypothetical protein [Psychromonas sp. psych-6C06]PKF63003.1 hypothetical protein CW745_06140 [Psychromonas sp. psych-6C06]
MEVLIAISLLFLFTVVPVKVGANILKIEGATLGVCFIGVLLSIVANVLATAFIGEGFFPSVVALLITGFFFSVLFKTNTVTGFVLATISVGVQLGLAMAAVGLGFAFLG